MTKAADDPNLEPFIDNLWYFDSVVSTKPALKKNKPPKPPPPPPAPAAADGCQPNPPIHSEISQLPLSTGGGSATYSGYDTDHGMDSIAETARGAASTCANCSKDGSERPCMCDLVKKMEKGVGELPAAELYLWMQKLGLEYTEDGTMIRRVPNANFGSQQKLDFSEFVCLNRFIDEERDTPQHAKRDGNYSDAHMASLYEVFRLFDKDDTGLISPSDLCAALSKLGLRRSS